MTRRMFQFACDEAMAADIFAAADARGISASEFVRALVADALRAETGRRYAPMRRGGARPRPPRPPAHHAP